MKFDRSHTLKEIMEYPGIKKYLDVFFEEYLLSLFPEDTWNLPLKEAEKIIGMTPWEEAFYVVTGQLLDAANEALDIMVNKTRTCIPLWYPEGREWEFPARSVKGKEGVFLIAPVYENMRIAGKDSRQKAAKPAVIICPGGGYEEVCFANEGSPMQNFMEEAGYVAFLLKYRVAPSRYPAPQMDLAMAILHVRSHAEEYGIDPCNLMLMGSSAGGHLCASQGALYKHIRKELKKELEYSLPEMAEALHQISLRPEKICLNYPVISMETQRHEGSFQCLTGGEEALRTTLSIDRQVGKEYPKTFVWACEDDELVSPSNARRMGEALEAHQVPFQLHIYPSGGHGCGLALTKEAKDWSSRMLLFMADIVFGIQPDSCPHVF